MADEEKHVEVRRAVESEIRCIDPKDIPAAFDEIMAVVKVAFVMRVFEAYKEAGSDWPEGLFNADFSFDDLRIVNGRDDTGRFPQIWDGSRRVL